MKEYNNALHYLITAILLAVKLSIYMAQLVIYNVLNRPMEQLSYYL